MTEPRVLSGRPTAAHLPGRADQISRAREFTKRVLGPCPVTDEAVLLVSERLDYQATDGEDPPGKSALSQ
jgi:hypothetical protein